MKIKSLFALIASLAVRITASHAQYVPTKIPNARPGKCYSKCQIVHSYDTVTHFIYTGQEFDDPLLEKLASDVYLADASDSSTTFWRVTDTIQIKDFEPRTFRVADATIEWREVLCGEKVTALTVRQIQLALQKRNYYTGDLTRTIDKKTKSALANFQRDHLMPIGNLDLETLTVLGITF